MDLPGLLHSYGYALIFFGTLAEGVKGKRAVAWRLVDAVYPASKFKEEVADRARVLAATSDRPSTSVGTGACVSLVFTAAHCSGDM